jgi:hypothetical protein
MACSSGVFQNKVTILRPKKLCAVVINTFKKGNYTKQYGYIAPSKCHTETISFETRCSSAPYGHVPIPPKKTDCRQETIYFQ